MAGLITSEWVLRPEVQPRTLFIHHFWLKGTHFVYLLLTNGTPNCCTCTVFWIWIDHETRNFSCHFLRHKGAKRMTRVNMEWIYFTGYFFLWNHPSLFLSKVTGRLLSASFSPPTPPSLPIFSIHLSQWRYLLVVLAKILDVQTLKWKSNTS